MDKVFHIRMFSSPNGGYREVELDLPATDYELLDAMEQLRQEDGKRPYLEFHKGRETIPIGSLIDYAYSGECCHVVEDAVTDEELGRFLVENGFIPETDAIPDAALELLDYAQIGKNHREAEGGTFTGFGYVERHSEPRQVYKTLELTPKKPVYTILAETFDGNRVRDGQPVQFMENSPNQGGIEMS